MGTVRTRRRRRITEALLEARATGTPWMTDLLLRETKTEVLPVSEMYIYILAGDAT